MGVINEPMVSVPREPTQEMIEALKAELLVTSRGGILRAGVALTKAIAAAPQPPAVIECGACGCCKNECRHETENPPTLAEVALKYVHPDAFPESVLDYRPEDLDLLKVGTELVDRVHVTQLQAEVQRLLIDRNNLRAMIAAVRTVFEDIVDVREYIDALNEATVEGKT